MVIYVAVGQQRFVNKESYYWSDAGFRMSDVCVYMFSSRPKTPFIIVGHSPTLIYILVIDETVDLWIVQKYNQ